MLVDLALVGVDGAALDLVDRDGPVGDLRFEEGVDEGDGPLPGRAVDFRRGAGADALGQLRVLQGDQLAVGGGEVEIVGPGALAAEERRGDAGRGGSSARGRAPARRRRRCRRRA